MAIAKVKLGNVEVTRLMLGGNPQSGFSHWDRAMDDEMQHYYTAANMKALYRQAEELGINTHIGRADHHVIRVLMEHWDEGGTIQWIAQTCPEVGTPERGALNGIHNHAKAVYIHGGHADFLHSQGRLKEIQPALDMIRDAGLPCGMAGHKVETFLFAEEHLDCDFYMCSYYSPISRDQSPEHITQDEYFDPEHRVKMCQFIQQLPKPVIHYKIMASGRNDPKEAFTYAARHMRPTDAVCVGVFPKRNPNELAEDVQHLKTALAEVGQEG